MSEVLTTFSENSNTFRKISMLHFAFLHTGRVFFSSVVLWLFEEISEVL